MAKRVKPNEVYSSGKKRESVRNRKARERGTIRKPRQIAFTLIKQWF